MVAAAPAGTGSQNPANPRRNACTPLLREHPENPHRPPLIPSENDNASGGGVTRLRTKEISSRYLVSYSASSSSTSTSYSAAICSGSSSSSRPSTSLALSQSAARKRSHSDDRGRPSSPRSHLSPAQAEPSAAARGICTTNRSLSVSLQGESYQTSRARAASSATPAVERRPAVGACSAPANGSYRLHTSRPAFENHHRWPASRPRQLNPLMRSLSCSSVAEEPILATVRLLQQSVVCDESTRRVSFEEADLSASTDTDSASTGSNSGTPEFGVLSRAKVIPHGITVPARFQQERNTRLSLYSEPCSSLSSPDSRFVVPKLGVVRKVLEIPLSSPRPASSPLRRHVRPPSPNKVAASPSRSMASPLRSRSNVSTSASTLNTGGNAPSIISFSAEVRRTKRGENRIEEAHSLRLLDNRHLQWRRINARINSAMLLQKQTVEKNLYDAWISTSELQDSITAKRIQILLMTQNLKFTSILRGQMAYLDEWSLDEGEYSTSLSGATDALNASTLRLPIVSGAKADILELKDAVGSSVDMMQTIGATICSLLSKVEGSDNLVSDITNLAQQERVLLDQSRDLLSTVAAMHVQQCSLQGHLIQLKRKACQTQVQS